MEKRPKKFWKVIKELKVKMIVKEYFLMEQDIEYVDKVLIRKFVGKRVFEGSLNA